VSLGLLTPAQPALAGVAVDLSNLDSFLSFPSLYTGLNTFNPYLLAGVLILQQIWTPKSWTNPSLKELAACTYQFVRLYIASFAYGAHVERAQARAEAEGSNGVEGKAGGAHLFPRGKCPSPSKRFRYRDSATKWPVSCGTESGMTDLLAYLATFSFRDRSTPTSSCRDRSTMRIVADADYCRLRNLPRCTLHL